MPHTMLNSGIESRFIDLMCYWHSCCCYLFMLVNSVSEIILSVHSTTWMNIYLYVLQYTIDLPHFPWENFKTVCVRPKLGIKFTICEINICQPHLSIHTCVNITLLKIADMNITLKCLLQTSSSITSARLYQST